MQNRIFLALAIRAFRRLTTQLAVPNDNFGRAFLCQWCSLYRTFNRGA